MKGYIKNNHHLNLGLLVILAASFALRAINLNYNSAFNDEAIYIVIGRMGLFASDWWSYGANIWMAGLPYVYPALSALAYQVGGVVGSRLLNVIFGTILIEEVYNFTKLLNLFDEKTNQKAALISAFITGFAAIGMYVSKLATYDMLSFLLMMIAINSFLKSGLGNTGKYYFVAAMFLVGAFLTKIVIAIFFPIFLVFVIKIINSRSESHKRMALQYFYIPILLGLAVYSLFSMHNLLLYVQTHRDTGLGDTTNIIEVIKSVTGPVFILSLPAALILVWNKKTKEVIALFTLAIVVPLFHLSLNRLATLDKHLYLSVIFLSVILGYGLTKLISVQIGSVKQVFNFSLILAGLYYPVSSYQLLLQMQQSWKNTANLQEFIKREVGPDNKVLTENGSAVILDLYDEIFPPKNIVTFDWINYSGKSGDDAYIQAIKDEYFDYVELDSQFEGKDSLRYRITVAMAENYVPVFNSDGFVVYGRRIKLNYAI